MATRVTVRGDDELVRKLQGLARKATPAQARAALMAGALPIQTSAAQKAAVDTGTLRRSIHTEAAETRDGAVARTGTNVEYALAQEFGTSRMRGQPFMRPAYDEKKGEALREMHRALREMVAP
jgi:HK97 gp10 family phage protein